MWGATLGVFATNYFKLSAFCIAAIAILVLLAVDGILKFCSEDEEESGTRICKWCKVFDL